MAMNRPRMGFLWILPLLFTMIWSLSGLAGSPSEEIYQKAVNSFRTGDFLIAATLFEQYIKAEPQGMYIKDAVYKCGEAFYRLGEKPRAAGYFKLYLNQFPLGNNSTDVKARLEAIGEIEGISKPELGLSATMLPIKAVEMAPSMAADMAALEGAMSQVAQDGAKSLLWPSAAQSGEYIHRFIVGPSVPEGYYFQTSHAKVVKDIFSDINRRTRKYDLTPIASFPLRPDFGKLLSPMSQDAAYDPGTDGMAPAGKPDLFDPSNVANLELLAEDLVNTSVDAVIITQLFVRPNEGFGEASLDGYKKAFGDSFTPKALFRNPKDSKDENQFEQVTGEFDEKIAPMRSHRIADVAGHIAKAIRKARPGVYVGVEMPVIVWIDRKKGQRLSIDPKLVLEMTKPDLLVLLVDPSDAAPGLTQDVFYAAIGKAAMAAKEAIGNEKHLVFRIKTIDRQSLRPLPDWMIEACAQACRQAGEVGIILSPYILGASNVRILFGSQKKPK